MSEVPVNAREVPSGDDLWAQLRAYAERGECAPAAMEQAAARGEALEAENAALKAERVTMRSDAEIEAAVSLIMKRRGLKIENGVMRAALAAADAVAPAPEDAGGRHLTPSEWKLVPEGANACMGSPLDALRYVLDSWREWIKYTGPLMGLPKELDERDAREREARSRLAHAAGTLSWHLDKSPSLVAMLAASPAPPADGWLPIASAPKGDPSRFDGPELLLGSIEGVHKGYWCHGDSQQPPGWIWDGDRDPTHWRPLPAPPEE